MAFCCSNLTYVAQIKTRLLLSQCYKAVGHYYRTLRSIEYAGAPN